MCIALRAISTDNSTNRTINPSTMSTSHSTKHSTPSTMYPSKSSTSTMCTSTSYCYAVACVLLQLRCSGHPAPGIVLFEFVESC